MSISLKQAIAGVLSGAAIMTAAPAAAAPVGLELVLLVDVSGSVDNTEYALQKSGYVQAFQSAAVQNAILASQGGAIAVTYVEWSSGTQQSQLVGWTLINSAASANAFAAAINGVTRAFDNNTGPGSAIQFGAGLFGTEVGGGAGNGFESIRQVIDVSGDGAENSGINTLAARNAALAAGVDATNGLPILGEAGLLAFYTNNIQGGAGSFTLAADSFADFSAAVAQKLTREITGTVPEPGSLALFGLALAGLGFARRQRSA